MSQQSKSRRPSLIGDHVWVTVVGYGSSGADGCVDLDKGTAHRNKGRWPWKPEAVPAERLAAARAAAEQLQAMGDRCIQDSQFTLGEVRFKVTLGGQTNTVTLMDEGGGIRNKSMNTLWEPAIRGPS